LFLHRYGGLIRKFGSRLDIVVKIIRTLTWIWKYLQPFQFDQSLCMLGTEDSTGGGNCRK
jgi:hypothetical protein